MPIEIKMPALSPTMEKGNLAKWHVKEGDSVTSGQVIAEIETDKATMEVESIDEGTVAKLVVAEGTQDVPVNQLIAILAGEGEDAASAASSAKAEKPASAEKPAPKQEAEAPQPASDQKEAEAPKAKAAVAPAEPQPAKANSNGQRLFASPLARRLAKERGVELSSLTGSGPHGRIVVKDLEGAKAGAPARSAAPSAAPAGQGDEAILRMFEPGSYDVIPHDSMRKVIARRLTESKLTVPHFYVTMDCEIDALLALRADMNGAAPVVDGNPAYKLSVNDFVIKALAMALKAVPDANVSWTDGGMLRHKSADVGVAVSIPGGLITPIVRKADEKTLSRISAEMKDYAKRARDRKLKPEEYTGGSSAVSNLGMFGVKDFAAIINPPQASILAVGAGEQRPVVKNGALAVATVMSATLSVDHRAVDGALGAELLAAFKRYIEKPAGMLA
jgi:pyruvate dehydrogenase E2 component (dihydrolipoamide acetyltransferase)